MDEDRRQPDADDGADHEPDGRLAPGVERRAHQELGERRIRSALHGRRQRAGDVPDVRQQQVGGEPDLERRLPGPAVAAPRVATDELDALPGDEDQRRERDEDRRRAAPSRAQATAASVISSARSMIAKPFGQLLLADGQRRVGVEVVPAHERVQAVLAEALAEGDHLVATCR